MDEGESRGTYVMCIFCLLDTCYQAQRGEGGYASLQSGPRAPLATSINF
jgi:hypothetical protein